MNRRAAQGFTLVEVLVALMIVAIGLAALMTAVSGTANASGYLRDKTIAQWIALNRIAEVRLNLQKLGQSTDTGELDFANRHWHYDTRYFDTSVMTMRRVVVRVWAGAPNTAGNPVAEANSFIGTAIALPGSSNIDWRQGSAAAANGTGNPGAPNGVTGIPTNGATGNIGNTNIGTGNTGNTGNTGTNTGTGTGAAPAGNGVPSTP